MPSLRVNHSKNAIVKPQGKTPEMAQREVDEAMKKVREATMAIANAVVEQRELLGMGTSDRKGRCGRGPTNRGVALCIRV